MDKYDDTGERPCDGRPDSEAAMLDDALRHLLNTVPTETASALPAEAAAEIRRAVSLAWPARRPPTPEELANENASGRDPYNDASLIDVHDIENKSDSSVAEDYGTQFQAPSQAHDEAPAEDDGHQVAPGNHHDVRDT
jgi:hypothetical protein